MRLVHLILILVLLPVAHAHFYFDYPLCPTCNRTVGNFGSDIKALIATGFAMMRRVCQIKESTEEACMATLNIARTILERLNNELFEKATYSAKTLACSHIFDICPDKAMGGKELDADKWSCASCSRMLSSSFTALSSSVKEFNNILPKLFCPSDDQECVTEFTIALKITGALGRLLNGEESTASICQKVLKCIK